MSAGDASTGSSDGGDRHAEAASLDAAEGPGPAGSEVLDLGLQHERTALAWDRTALALIVVGALSVRVAGGPFGELLHLPGYLVIAVGASLLWLGARRYRRRDHDLRAGGYAVGGRLVSLTGAAAVGIGLASLVLVLVP